MTRTDARGRRGVALLTALVAVLLLALAAIALQHVARGNFQRTRDEQVARHAEQAADAGAFDVMRRWGTTAVESLAVGDVLGPDSLQLTDGRAVVRTLRTSRATFWTVSEGSSGDSLARTLGRRSVHVAYRLALPNIVAGAALTVRDSLALVGGASVIGRDTALAAWGGMCTAPAPVAAVALPDSLRLCDGGCGGARTGGRTVGLPPVVQDSFAADTARYRRFGSEDWGSLAAHAHIVLAPGAVVTPGPVASGGQCDRTRADNWGDPGGVGPCATYAPLIWARGDVELRGGAGQGLLLVDGDLTLSAGARFAGVVLVRDDLLSSGIGGTVLGAVLAEDARVAPGDHSRLDGATRVQRSQCAVDLALERSARLVRVRARGWAPLR